MIDSAENIFYKKEKRLAFNIQMLLQNTLIYMADYEKK